MLQKSWRCVRIVAVLVFMLALLLLPAGAYASPPSGAEATIIPPGTPGWVIATLGLHLRTEACLSSPSLMILSYGAKVYVQAAPVVENCIAWSRVAVCRWGRIYYGYCATQWLRYVGKPTTSLDCSAYCSDGQFWVKVTVAELRLRSGPSTGYLTRFIVPRGAMFVYTGEHVGNWVKLAIICPTLDPDPAVMYAWAYGWYLRPACATSAAEIGPQSGSNAKDAAAQEMLSELPTQSLGNSAIDRVPAG
jgi:hypothetical protein